jgi:hypothetical protein
MKQKLSMIVVLLILMAIKAQSQGLSVLKKMSEKRVEKRNNRWSEEKIFKQTLIGFAYQTTQNTNFSANQYPGFLLSARGTSIRETQKRFYHFDNVISAGILSLPESIAQTYTVNTRFSHSILRKINPTFALGSQMSAVFNGRLNLNNENNAFLMEAVLDLGPRIKFQKEINLLHKNYGIEYGLAVPLIGFGYSAPSFNTSFDGSNTKGIFLPNKYQRIQSELMLKFPAGKRFPNKNFKMGYHWDFMHLNLGNNRSLNNAVHTLSFIGSIKKIK